MRERLQIAVLALSILTLPLQSQERFDSLIAQADTTQNDSLKIVILLKASQTLLTDNQDLARCEEVLQEALRIAAKDSTDWALSKVHNKFGTLYRNKAEYDQALSHHHQSLYFAKKTGDNQLLASAYNSIGVVYRRLDNHPKAAEYHIQGLKAAEAINDLFSVSVSLNSLGNIYSLNGQYPEALSYFTRGLTISQNMNNPRGEAMNYNNIGEVYEFMEQYDSAMVYYTHSLRLNRAINNQRGKSISYNAIGKIHLYKGKPEVAADLFNQALKIDLELGDRKFIVDTYTNLARSYTQMGMLDEAEKYAQKALEMANDINSVIHMQWTYETLSTIYEKRQIPTKALAYFKQATLFKDSVINEKNSRAISMLEVMFGMDKKEQEIQILKQQRDLNKKELARQVMLRNFYLAGLVFSISIIIITLYAFNVKRKSTRQLQKYKETIEENSIRLNIQQGEILAQTTEIEKLQHCLARKDQNLEDAYLIIDQYVGNNTNSIRYAQKIQNALFPPLELTSPHFTEAFALHIPKNIVSGDFYWISQRWQSLYIAVADCTGYGVPGAFMSIIGMDLLNQAISQNDEVEPLEILSFLDVELRNKLRKEDDELVLKDSMDVAVIKYQLGSHTLEYSSAHIPMAIVRNNELIEQAPTQTSIGISSRLKKKTFTQAQISIQAGDWIYLYTDGFVDQFGGENKSKFLRKRFLSSLLDVSKNNSIGQKEELDAIFKTWKGNNEQTDDVLILGLKV